jgi:hypothetical protein
LPCSTPLETELRVNRARRGFRWNELLFCRSLLWWRPSLRSRATMPSRWTRKTGGELNIASVGAKNTSNYDLPSALYQLSSTHET